MMNQLTSLTIKMFKTETIVVFFFDEFSFTARRSMLESSLLDNMKSAH